ncbi:MAG: VCBS repeat-containing protein [Rhodothermales bacterium]|nr:VCBS repeat-containing protein [Rhodothermales bacterium]
MRLIALIALLVASPATLHGQALALRVATETQQLQTSSHGIGVSAFDIDRDGLPDITIAAWEGASRVFLNAGNGTFDEITHRFDLPVGGTAIALWSDVNGDGTPDLFVGQGRDGENRLLLGRSDGTWTSAPEWGVRPDAVVGSGAFGDFDSDGYVDLFLAVQGGCDLLYRNVDGQRFEDVTALHGVSGDCVSKPMQAVWIDFDKDLDLDLLATHDLDVESRLHLNDGTGVWPDVAQDNGMAYVGPGSSMGIAWGDTNLDGHLDAYISRIEFGGLYMNRGNNTFSDEASALGAEVNGVSWGVLFVDLDNDRDEDLFVNSTSAWNNEPPLLWENRDAYFFDVGMDFIRGGKGAAAADFDLDGRVDIAYVANGGENGVLMNTSEAPGNSLSLRLLGSATNRFAIGARVEVHAGGQRMTRFVSGGDSYNSQSSDILHVGLGDAGHADSVVVWWPERTVDTYYNLSANRRHDLLQAGATTTTSTPAPSALDLWPNPAHGMVHATGVDAGAQVRLFDVLGRQVQHVAVSGGRVTLSGLAPGLYVVVVQSGGLQERRLFVSH